MLPSPLTMEAITITAGVASQPVSNDIFAPDQTNRRVRAVQTSTPTF